MTNIIAKIASDYLSQFLIEHGVLEHIVANKWIKISVLASVRANVAAAELHIWPGSVNFLNWPAKLDRWFVLVVVG